ncbi:MAG: formylglycine-generating enzyme family protein [Chthoniobacterales bacterium]
MLEAKLDFPLPLPDDPKKWDGWKQYKSPNFYERLCLNPREQPNAAVIEEHCRELLRWWQKKLPLKNQPSNPITQLLRPGLDESSRYLTEARVELLDPNRRRAMDEELAVQAQEQAIAEFHKYLTFAIADGQLTPDGEKNLLRFGREHQLQDEAMLGYIEAELRDSGAHRALPPEQVTPEPPPLPRVARGRRQALPPDQEFMRMLRLSGLDSDGMGDETRDAFINMAENMGLDPGDAEDIVDRYLDDMDAVASANIPPPPAKIEVGRPAPVQVNSVEEAAVESVTLAQGALPDFTNSVGAKMICVPSGEFTLGSEAFDAGPNERPLTKVTLSRFYMSRFPVTNAEYEEFDPGHVRKRAPGAGDTHPVVYVGSLEAIKFCSWLGARERKKYRLPTEAEWEYAARGTDGRKFPWGNHEGRGDLANFADKNTVFAWSDREISDGYPESSPVGAFPLGASPFGLEDLAGNVWEWCHDFFENYRGTHKINPRGANAGAKRVYRGGSWKSRFNSLRATTRGFNVPTYSCNDLGFRIVCESE